MFKKDCSAGNGCCAVRRADGRLRRIQYHG